MINSVIHGDCLEVMKDIPDKSIDMILCDLPYGTTACKWDTVLPFDKLWAQYERIIKDNGAIVLTASQPFTSALVMSNPKIFKYEWVWDKVSASNFQNAKKQPLRQHENILVFYKKQPNYNPQMEDGESFVRKSSGEVWEGFGKTGIKSGFATVSNGKRYPKTIIKKSNAYQKGKLHPTQKPVELFEYLIKTYTNEGQTILDNCAGSGTTAIAAINTGRNYILIEKEKEYIDIINKRIEGDE